ncbi:MAG TPA: 2-phosphosulfolactate phosphatase [Deinococcales bacterium]|nr:2-phosphosulfolactate phosphatase [Deinococcales bacterium]
MNIHTELLPREEASDVVIIVDTLRSCTAASVAFQQGLSTLDFTPSLRVARRAGAEFGLLLLGERRGMVPEGFNHSNSPVQLRQLDLAGKAALMVSENAPHAVGFHAGARHVLLGSLHNAAAVAARAAELAQTSITVTCSGFRDEEDLDDSITAAYITAQLKQLLPDAASGGADALLNSLLRAFPDPLDALWHSTAGRYLRRLEHAGDIGMAGCVSVSTHVPERTEVIRTADGSDLQRFTVRT